MKNRAEFKTRKALFIDECKITDFEWDEADFFGNIAVMSKVYKYKKKIFIPVITMWPVLIHCQVKDYFCLKT